MKSVFLTAVLFSISALGQEIQQQAGTEAPPAAAVVQPEVSLPVPAPTPQPQPVSNDVPIERTVKVAVMAYFSSANQFKFESVVASSATGSETGNGYFNTDSASGIGVEVYDSKKHQWGWAIGATYDFERKVNSFYSQSNGNISTGIYMDPKPTITIFTAYANLIYKWEQFYIPFGFNLAYVELMPSNNNVVTSQSGIGAQLGFGIQLTENAAIEFLSRSVSSRIRSTSPTTAVDYGNGTLGGSQFIFKVSF